MLGTRLIDVQGQGWRELDGQTYDIYPEAAAKEMPDRRIRLKMLEESRSR